MSQPSVSKTPSPPTIRPFSSEVALTDPVGREGERLGIIVRTDSSGLGYQSRALAKMLRPHKILLLGKDELPDYSDYFKFLDNIDVMLTCETPYIYDAWNWARERGIKTFCQPNWELFDGLVQPNMPHPDQYLIPSYWHLDDFKAMFPNSIYLPPPTIDLGLSKLNFQRTGKRRFVHIIGANAIYDRNGWVAIMDCLKDTTADFELHVYSQQEMTGYSDSRVIYHVMDVGQEELYANFDALIMPRRYGGLNLPMNEALMAGLPVIMTDISPNNKILPQKWLCESEVTAVFEGRSTIEVYSPKNLAGKLDWLCSLDDKQMLAEKRQAYQIALDNYSMLALRAKYEKILT